MATVKKMMVEDWIAVAPNPIQRNTERHLAKAKHLHTFHPTHSVVHAAQLPNDGKMFKLDGHTRALGWKRKMFPAPTQVTVLVYPAKDMAEVEQLYKDFDSKDALETQRDKVSGAFNRHNFEAQSGLLSAGNITYALRIATGILFGLSVSTSTGGASKTKATSNGCVAKQNAADVYSMVNEWSYELHALDGFGLGQGQASAGIVSAFLVSYRKYGHKITPFWQAVFGGQGNKINGQMDAIQAIIELILQRKGRAYGGQSTADLCARALMAVEKWLKDDMLFSVPRPLDTTGYLAGHEKPTERLIKKADLERAKINRERASAHA